PKHHMGVIRVVRTVGLRSQPQVPIESHRYGWGIGGQGCVLRPDRAVRPVVDFPEGADGPLPHPGQHRLHGSVRIPRHEVSGNTGFARGIDHLPDLLQPVAERLVNDDVLPFAHGRDADRRVQVIRGHDLDCVQVFFFFQQLPNIGVRRTSFEFVGRPLPPVISLDNVLSGIPPTGYRALAAGPPVWFLQRFANGVEQAITRPVPVAGGLLVWVTYGSDLDLRYSEQRKHLAQTLRPGADVCQRNLVARRNESRSSQYMPGDNSERGGAGCRGSQESATIRIGCHLQTSRMRSIIAGSVDQGKAGYWGWVLEIKRAENRTKPK